MAVRPLNALRPDHPLRRGAVVMTVSGFRPKKKHDSDPEESLSEAKKDRGEARYPTPENCGLTDGSEFPPCDVPDRPYEPRR